MFEDLEERRTKKKTHKDFTKEKNNAGVKKVKTLKPSKPFKEGSDGFVRSTISIPNDFGKFLHEEILYGGIKKKKLTEVIMNLLEEEYGKKFMVWKEENE